MSDADPQPGTDGGSTATTAERVRRGLDYALLGGLVLLGFVAAVQFYFAADRTINVWVTREYRPPFKMVFNLVVLLVVGVGVSRQVRRLTATVTGEDPDASDGSDAGDDTAPEATTDGGVIADSSTFDTENTTARDAAGTAAVSSDADGDVSAATDPPAASGGDGSDGGDGRDRSDGGDGSDGTGVDRGSREDDGAA